MWTGTTSKPTMKAATETISPSRGCHETLTAESARNGCEATAEVLKGAEMIRNARTACSAVNFPDLRREQRPFAFALDAGCVARRFPLQAADFFHAQTPHR